MAMKTRTINEVLFEQPGEVVEGRLMRATPIRYKDGGTNVEYIILRTSGGLALFRGSSMLNKLLFSDDVGKLMVVKYEGKDAKPVAEGMSARKIFDVQVDDDSNVGTVFASSPKGNTLSDGTKITDDDVPF